MSKNISSDPSGMTASAGVRSGVQPAPRIRLECPECGHTQMEPAMVMSTLCHICRAHYRVEDGKAVKRPREVARYGKPPAEEPPPPPPPATVSTPRAPRAAPRWQPVKSLLRVLLRPAPARQVVCFDCERSFSTAAEAQSSQCPHCGCYISLADHIIDGPHNREIHTRGNVTILKSGVFTGTSLRAHNLTVLGELRSPADCSGDVAIQGHGRLTGAIRCHTLRVERRSRVEFLQPVRAAQVVIDGHVRGRIECQGTVLLRQRSHLHGYVRAAALVAKSGARHHGVFETSAPGANPT